MKEAQHLLGDSIEYSSDQHDALIDADALLIITEWPEFRAPNFKVIGRLMKEQVIFDGRNIYDTKEMEESGFTYYSIGVKPHYYSSVDLA
jgi:UDPglucose 6-dehydrogenase